MKILLSLLLLLMGHMIYAEDGFPVSCKPIAVQGESIVLKAKEPQVVLIHNLSPSDLWITHPVSDPGASAGWSSRLEAGNWSALAVDKESFELSCIESKPGHEQQVPCSGVTAVCEWQNVKIPEQSTGTFWAGENLTLPALTGHLHGRGFVLPALGQ
jgi:hypothetical protein